MTATFWSSFARIVDSESRARAERWTGEECRLNGKPARIVGRKLAHAVVVSEREHVEFSWSAVDHVMNSSKGFRS